MATDTSNVTAVLKNPSKTPDTSTKPDRVKDSASDKSTTTNLGKDGDDSKTSKIIASTVSDTEKKIRRAERFGITVQLSEKEKRNSRAERFGTGSTMPASDGSKHSEELKRKARAERFGLPVQSVPSDEEARKKARLERFGPDAKTGGMEEEKRKARALRFSQPAASSLSMNGKGNIEPKEAITSKAGGGS